MQKIFHFLENIRAKHIIIFIIGALVLSKIFVYVLEDLIVNIFQAIYTFSPGFIQVFLYPVSNSLSNLQPTKQELSILFAINVSEFIPFFIQAMAIGAIFWLIFEKINNNNRLADRPEMTSQKYTEIKHEMKKVTFILLAVFIGSFFVRSIIPGNEHTLIVLFSLIPVVFSIVYGFISIKHKKYPSLLIIFIILSLSGILMFS
jgi:hypothetical protein